MATNAKRVFALNPGTPQEAEALARRIALAMVLSPRPGTMLASRVPAVLERPTQPGGGDPGDERS